MGGVGRVPSWISQDAADFEASWERVEELFDEFKTKERITPELNTAELLQLTFEMHEKWKEHLPTWFGTCIA